MKRQHGFFAGNARIAVLPAATGAELGAFLKANVAAGSHLLTDGFAGYRGGDASLGEHLKHTPVVQGEGANAGEFFPIIHTLFSNIKAWLVGTHHGVSAKHLPRYLREWSYRFNRRNLPDGLDGYLIRRAVECAVRRHRPVRQPPAKRFLCSGLLRLPGDQQRGRPPARRNR